MLRWSVHMIGGEHVEHLGAVNASDETEAIARAVRAFQIPPKLHSRVIVAPTEVSPKWFRSWRRWCLKRRKIELRWPAGRWI